MNKFWLFVLYFLGIAILCFVGGAFGFWAALFILLLFVGGYFIFKKSKISFINQKTQDAFYAQVAIEVQEKNFKPDIVAKATAESNGNKDLAQSLYIKHRVDQLMREFKERQGKLNRELWVQNVGGIVFTIIIIAIVRSIGSGLFNHQQKSSPLPALIPASQSEQSRKIEMVFSDGLGRTAQIVLPDGSKPTQQELYQLFVSKYGNVYTSPSQVYFEDKTDYFSQEILGKEKYPEEDAKYLVRKYNLGNYGLRGNPAYEDIIFKFNTQQDCLKGLNDEYYRSLKGFVAENCVPPDNRLQSIFNSLAIGEWYSVANKFSDAVPIPVVFVYIYNVKPNFPEGDALMERDIKSYKKINPESKLLVVDPNGKIWSY